MVDAAVERKLLAALALAIALAGEVTHADESRLPASGLPPQPSLTVRELVSLSDVGGYTGSLSLSPDGSHIAFQLAQPDLATNTTQLSWWIAPVRGSGQAIRVGDGGEPILDLGPRGYPIGTLAEIVAQWSPNGRWIAYRRRDHGSIQVWRSRVDGAIREQVTANPADVIDLRWRDNDSLYFEVGRDRSVQQAADQAESDRGYLLDERFVPDDPRPLWQPCGPDPWGIPRPAAQRCSPILWITRMGGTERKADAAELSQFQAQGVLTRPPHAGVERRIQGVVHSRDGTHVAWLENEDPRDKPGFAAPLTLFADGKRCPRVQCHGQLRQAWWSEGRLYWLRQEGQSFGVPAIYEWRPGTERVRAVYREDSVLESCMLSGPRLVCIREMPSSPRKIVAIELRSGVVSTIYDPNPQFSRFNLGRVEKLQWQDAFGNDAFGHLVYPPEYRPGRAYPLVIVQYWSRGFLNGGTGREYPIFPLAGQGFLVLSFDEPIDWGSLEKLPPGDFEKMKAYEARMRTHSCESRMSLTALDNILDRLTSRGIADPARIGITGLSEGANTVAYALSNSKRYAAAAMSGIWSPTHYFEIAGDDTRESVRASMSARNWPELLDRFRSESLMFNADKVVTPLLIQVSDSELIQTLPTYVALKEAGDPIEAYVFADEYHIKRLPLHKLAVGERMIDWFRFWLMRTEDAAPAKREQYARWRQLRAQQERVVHGREASPPAAGTQDCLDAKPFSGH